jgi:hypothetical protein
MVLEHDSAANVFHQRRDRYSMSSSSGQAASNVIAALANDVAATAAASQTWT